jgi:hypothetical protein
MLKATGSKVRCSVCATVFTAFPLHTPSPESVTPAPEVNFEPETETPLGSDLAAASAMATFESDGPIGDDTTEPDTSRMDPSEEITGAATNDDTNLDAEQALVPEDDTRDVEIETVVPGGLDDDSKEVPFESEPDDDIGATVIASLDDDDLDLDIVPDTDAVEDSDATVIANLDDDDFELTLEGDTDAAAPAIDDLDKEDLELDLDGSLETDGDADGVATIIVDLDDDDLNLNTDLSLESDDVVETASFGDTLTDDIEDIDDFDLSLDDGTLDDLTLDMDRGDDETSVEASPVLEDDLDLSSLESLLQDDDEADDDDTVPPSLDVGEEPELELDLEEAPPAAAEPEDLKASEETLEDLEFDLAADGQEIDLEPDDTDQEVDLSEIEKMLEEPETEAAKFSDVPDQDLDLDIEASLETEKWMSESGDDDQLVKDEELDLSELEQVLDEIGDDDIDDTLEDPELEFDLADGAEPPLPSDTIAADDDLDFDLSDFEDDASKKMGSVPLDSDSGDIDLEFEVEEGRSEEVDEDEGLEETVVISEPGKDKDEVPPSETEKPAPLSKPKTTRKKGMSKSLVTLLIIVLLGGGGYGTYYMLDKNNIDIPFLSDYLKPGAKDPGSLKLTTYDINSRFIENASVGKLFVISGKVKNGYSQNRSMVTLVGKIFSAGKVPVHQETVYCGNVMSDLELANLEWDKIKTRLSNRLGDNRSNVKIEPGKSISFMVVFSGLPEDLEEFTIEIVSSTSLN